MRVSRRRASGGGVDAPRQSGARKPKVALQAAGVETRIRRPARGGRIVGGARSHRRAEPSADRAPARCTIRLAKPCQVVYRRRCEMIGAARPSAAGDDRGAMRRTASAISRAEVGRPNWSATTRSSSRVAAQPQHGLDEILADALKTHDVRRMTCARVRAADRLLRRPLWSRHRRRAARPDRSRHRRRSSRRRKHSRSKCGRSAPARGAGGGQDARADRVGANARPRARSRRGRPRYRRRR